MYIGIEINVMIVEYKPHNQHPDLLLEDMPDISEAYRAAEWWQSDSPLRRTLQALMNSAIANQMPAGSLAAEEDETENMAIDRIFEGETATEILQLLELQAKYGYGERAISARSMLKAAGVEFDNSELVVPILQQKEIDILPQDLREQAGSVETGELYVPAEFLDLINA